jgi:hypothetical protein
LPEPRGAASRGLAARVGAAALGVVATAAMGMPSAALAAQAGAEGEVQLRDPRISESSGLALSRAHPHTVWTANDSGDSARVFAVDTRTGETVGVHTFEAPVRDVEAIAVTDRGRMLVADIGDNARSRDPVRVYSFNEPALGDTSGSAQSWELAYPDGPHDAEALAVDPVSGRIHVVTKATDGSAGIYALPATPSRRGANRLTRVAAAPALVTDAVYLDDGSALAVRSYTTLALLDPDTWRATARQALPAQPQGETLALAPGRRDLLVGSEGVGSRLLRITVASSSASAGATSTAPAGSATGTSTTELPSTGVSGAPAPAPRSPAADGRQLALGLGGSVLLVVLSLLVARLARRSRGR